MKTIKPQHLGVLTRSCENGDEFFLAVAVLVPFSFDEHPGLLPEVEMWKLLSRELGKDVAIDAAMPKSRGEVLLHATAHPYGGEATACSVRVCLGSIDKTLYVVGDRHWHHGAPSPPKPFVEMPITWERAYGGPEFQPNPRGIGAPARGSPDGRPLPNVEDPRHLLMSPRDRVELPAGFGAYDVAWPQRASKVGTYDAQWLETRFPGFAADLDWELFNAAPSDQRIDGAFRGDEPFTLEHMHPTKVIVEGRLPGVAARVFLDRRPMVAGGEPRFEEVAMRLDTVFLLPHRERGVAIFHGMRRVDEDDAADVRHAIFACEKLEQAKPEAHYRAVLAQRLDRRKGHLYLLRDRDLMPEGFPRGRATLAEDASEPEGMFAQRLRRKMERDRAASLVRMRALGLEPTGLPELPPEEPAAPPNPEDLDRIVEETSLRAESMQAEAETKRAEAEGRARAACAAAGVDYDAMKVEAEKNAGGPPKFSADEQLAALRAIAAVPPGAMRPDPAIEAMISDPDIESKLRAMESFLCDNYRQNAHRMPPARALDADAAEASRVRLLAVRESHRRPARIDLTGADLSGLDLHGLDLREAFLERAILVGCDGSSADFTRAVLARANLTDANLAWATFTDANLGGADLTRATLSGGVDMRRVVLVGAKLEGANLEQARLEGADLSEAELGGASLAEIVAPRLFLAKGDLRGACLRGANLEGATLLEVLLADVDLSGALLAKATMVGAAGEGASFARAELTNLRLVEGCSFERADFREARLTGANLRGTRLRGADFTGAILDGADLSECDLRGAKLDRVTGRELRLTRADLHGASITSADLMSASFDKAAIGAVDFAGTNLFRADFARTKGDAVTKLTRAYAKQTRVVRRGR